MKVEETEETFSLNRHLQELWVVDIVLLLRQEFRSEDVALFFTAR